jgi:hypothetical protein
MQAIMGFFKLAGALFGGIKDWGFLILEAIKLIKALVSYFKEIAEKNRREKYAEGVDEKDTIKIEESFGSPNAGKPDNIGDIEWDDEKTPT